MLRIVTLINFNDKTSIIARRCINLHYALMEVKPQDLLIKARMRNGVTYEVGIIRSHESYAYEVLHYLKPSAGSFLTPMMV